MPKYTLQTLLSTFTNKQGKKLLIFNAKPIGGLSSGIIKMLFILLPFIEYALIFNPFVFNLFGIATAIVVFIVFLSIVMVIIFFSIYKIKQKVIKNINSSWQYYFNDIDLRMVLSSGITPYSKFFDYYCEYIKAGYNEEELRKKLRAAFDEMKEENKELLNAIKKDNKNI